MGDPFGFSGRPRRAEQAQHMEHVLVQKALSRILAFNQLSIDDVVNDPIARNKVRSYYKLHRWIDRQCEIGELERQWNPVG